MYYLIESTLRQCSDKEIMGGSAQYVAVVTPEQWAENENNFFKIDNIRFFKLFSNRVSRLYDIVNSLMDYTNQIRDTYESRIEVRQNHIMTLLTVVTTIFMPLTLIAGWYGMNFKYMPELNWVLGYPAVFAVSVIIVIGSLLFFRKKKWL